MRSRHLLVFAVVGVVTSGCRGCGARGGLPPAPPPLATSKDGAALHVVDHGEYKAYYDEWGRLVRIEQDSNGDGRPDRISHHVGQKQPQLIEIDQDFDGVIDRWEYYDESGHLLRVGASRRGGVADTWVYRDGRFDRWQEWASGRLIGEDLDTDADGRPDRHVTYDSRGRPVTLEPTP